MKRSLKNSKVSRCISVGAAGVALAALIGAGSAVGTVNVFAQEDTAVTTEQIEENVTVTDPASEAEQTGDATAASPDTAEDREENDTPEKTKAEVKTGAVNEYEKAETIMPAKTEERPETGGVGAVNTVEAVKNGWVKENGGYKYYKNGKAYTGWHKMGKAEGEKTPHWSYFGKNGVVYTGWRKMGKAEGEKTTHWSFFGSNGWLRTGWVQLGKGTANPDGNSAKHWSFFGDNGWLRTGWVQLGKGTANPDGNTAKHWSYFGGNGWLRTGWVQFGKGTSEPDGNTPKHWSYFGDNGWLRTGWQDMGKGTKNPDGNSAKHRSYFGSNGWLRTGNKIIDDDIYSFNDSGWLLDAYYENGKLFTGVLNFYTERITGLDPFSGIYYKNGKRYTGHLKDFPKTINITIYDAYEYENGKRVQYSQTKFEPYEYYIGATNGELVTGHVRSYVEKNELIVNDPGAKGTIFEIKVGNDNYKGEVKKDNIGNSVLTFKSKRYYSAQETKCTITVTYAGKKFEGNGIIHKYGSIDWEKKGAAYYKKIKGYEPYEVAYYYSGEKGSVPQLVIREKKGGKIANFGTFKLDLSTGIGVDMNNGTTVDFTKY